MLKVSSYVAEWFLKQHKKPSSINIFNEFSPYYCKLCDKKVPPKKQNKHYKKHLKELPILKKKEQQEQQEQQEAEENALRESYNHVEPSPNERKRTSGERGSDFLVDSFR